MNIKDRVGRSPLRVEDALGLETDELAVMDRA